MSPPVDQKLYEERDHVHFHLPLNPHCQLKKGLLNGYIDEFMLEKKIKEFQLVFDCQD